MEIPKWVRIALIPPIVSISSACSPIQNLIPRYGIPEDTKTVSATYTPTPPDIGFTNPVEAILPSSSFPFGKNTPHPPEYTSPFLPHFTLLEKPAPIPEKRMADLVDSIAFENGLRNGQPSAWTKEEEAVVKQRLTKFLKVASATRLLPFEIYEMRFADIRLIKGDLNETFIKEKVIRLKDLDKSPHEFGHLLGEWGIKGLNESFATVAQSLTGPDGIGDDKFDGCGQGGVFDYDQGLRDIRFLESGPAPHFWDLMTISHWNYIASQPYDSDINYTEDLSILIGDMNNFYRNYHQDPSFDILPLLRSTPSLLCR